MNHSIIMAAIKKVKLNSSLNENSYKLWKYSKTIVKYLKAIHHKIM